MKQTKTRTLTLVALFAALTAIGSQILVPLPFTPVPINLALVSVFVAGAVLGPKLGTVSQLIFLLVGALGVPVFAGFKGGPGALVGPTAGYLWGYLLASLLAGLLSPKQSVLRGGLGMVAGLAACYGAGTLWFMFSTGRGLWESLLLCVIPFLVGDAFKIGVSLLISRRLSVLVREQFQ